MDPSLIVSSMLPLFSTLAKLEGRGESSFQEHSIKDRHEKSGFTSDKILSVA